MPSEEFSYIDSTGQLDEFCRQLQGAPWLCLDTEFVREKTYYPKLCLIQVATPEHVACIDPLALDNLDPLLERIYDPNTVKVLHAARQDLEILFNLRGEVPGPIFDTQIAAALLCHNDQIGYANLVQRTLGVQLDKAHTRADWSRRPLEPAQLRYAADDVRYLCEVYCDQVKALSDQGRLSWLEEDFQQLQDPRNYETTPREAWRRIKEARKLKGRQLAVLRTLAAWRERTAMEQNRPRKWIMRDEVLTELARFMPQDTAGMTKIRGLSQETVSRWGEKLLGLIDEGKATPRADWPTLESRTVLQPEQEAVVDALSAVVRLRANEQQLSATMLASRRALEGLVAGDGDSPVIHGWRARIVGNDLQALLAGESVLRVDDGTLILKPTP